MGDNAETISHQQRVCDSCGKTAEQGTTLKRCAKCHTTLYCSRECQKESWKTHKKKCGKSDPSTTKNDPFSSDRRNGHYVIEDPFGALEHNTWLHNRPENIVFNLLIDTYRLHVEDDYQFNGDVAIDSILDGGSARAAFRGFDKFLRKAEKRQPSVLPPWWSKQKGQECRAFFSIVKGHFSASNPVEKSDIVEYYGDPTMPIQLRLLAQKILGKSSLGVGRAMAGLI